MQLNPAEVALLNMILNLKLRAWGAAADARRRQRWLREAREESVKTNDAP